MAEFRRTPPLLPSSFHCESERFKGGRNAFPPHSRASDNYDTFLLFVYSPSRLLSSSRPCPSPPSPSPSCFSSPCHRRLPPACTPLCLAGSKEVGRKHLSVWTRLSTCGMTPFPFLFSPPPSCVCVCECAPHRRETDTRLGGLKHAGKKSC